jgi:hypothetical protein
MSIIEYFNNMTDPGRTQVFYRLKEYKNYGFVSKVFLFRMLEADGADIC